MPVINVEDLTDKDKAVMEVNQLKIEIKLERWLVSFSFHHYFPNDSFNINMQVCLYLFFCNSIRN